VGFCVTEDIPLKIWLIKRILEVSFLLVFGELPTAVQLKQFEDDIRKYVNEEMKSIIDGFQEQRINGCISCD
jgi:citrate synthase